MGKTRRWTVSLLCLSILLAAPAAMWAQEATAPSPATKAAPPADPTAVLKVIPENATAFLAVRNLQEFDQDIIDVAIKLGIPLGPNGVFPGVLDLMKSNLQIAAGLQDNSSLAAVVLDCRQVQSFQDIPAALLVPCSNPEALTKTMNPQETEVEGVMKLDMMGSPLFGATKGNFLVLSAQPANVQAVVKAEGKGILQVLSPKDIDAFQKQAVTGWANTDNFSTQLRTELENTLIGMMMMGDPSADMSQINATVQQVLQTIKETEKMSMGVVLNKKVGLKLILTTIMKPGTEFGKQMATMQPVESPLLIGLPKEQTIIAAGSSMKGDKEIAKKQMQKTWDQVFSSPEMQETIGVEKMELLKKQLTAMFVHVDQFSFSMSALPINSKDGLIGMAAAFKTGDSKKYQANLADLFATAKETVLKAMNGNEAMTEEELKTFSDAAQWKQDAEQIEGLTVDHLIIDLSQSPGMDEETLKETKQIIGQEGILLRVAAVDEKWMVATFGGSKARFQEVVELTRQGKAPLNDSMMMRKIADRLPSQNRLAEVYIQPDNLLGLISNVTQTMGQQLPFPMILANAAPIAMTATKVGETGQQLDILVPIELAVSVSQLARPFIGMMMMGGQQGMQPGMQPGMSPGMPTQPSKKQPQEQP